MAPGHRLTLRLVSPTDAEVGSPLPAVMTAAVYQSPGVITVEGRPVPGDFPNDLFIDPDDVPLDGVAGALEALATGRIAGKVMVTPEVHNS